MPEHALNNPFLESTLVQFLGAKNARKVLLKGSFGAKNARKVARPGQIGTVLAYLGKSAKSILACWGRTWANLDLNAPI